MRRCAHDGHDAQTAIANVSTVLCDLDGVVWLAQQPIPGSPEAVARLRAAGWRVLFVTNNSAVVVAEQERALLDIGIPAEGDVLTRPGPRRPSSHLVSGCWCAAVPASSRPRGPSVRLSSRTACRDAVLVGFHRDFDYERLADRRDGGHQRGAADRDQRRCDVSDAGRTDPGRRRDPRRGRDRVGVVPVIAGKPYAPMAELVRRAVGPGSSPTRR